MTTGIVWHEDYLLHEQHPRHPERRERLAYTSDQLFEEGIWEYEQIRKIKPRPASPDELLAVHDADYLRFLIEADITGGIIDEDTIIPMDFLRTAILAAGGAVSAAEAVIDGFVENAFAMVRPPGHHAGIHTGGGFCYLNNLAIMVKAIQKKGPEKIMILDWDAHHGNGTQEIFYHDKNVLFTSIHQSQFYPGTGRVHEFGEGEGAGYTINMPVPPGSSDEVYEYLFSEIIRPVAEEFSPDFIAVSAGQDNHFTDPIADLALTAQGYASMMGSATELAEQLCSGRIVAVMEGGYSVEGGLPYVNLGIIAALAGLDISAIREPHSYLKLLHYAREPDALILSKIMADDLKKVQSAYWDCF